MAERTLFVGFLFLCLVYLVTSQSFRASFSNKQNPNAKTQFSGKPTSRAFSAKNSRFTRRPSTFGVPRALAQGFHRTQSTVTTAPFRRQFQAKSRGPSFFGRRQQMATDPPFNNRQQTKNSWVSPNTNNQRSNNGQFRSNMNQQQNVIQPQKNNRNNGFPTYRPVLRQFNQPMQFKKEPITTQAPSGAAFRRFNPGFDFGNANSPPYRFEPSAQPQSQRQGGFQGRNQGNNQVPQPHPMADSLIKINPPPPPSRKMPQNQGGMGGGKPRGQKNNSLKKIGMNNIMNNPPPQLLANKTPLFKKPTKPNNGNWRNNPNPRRQGGNRRVNGQGKPSNWMKRKQGGRNKPRQRPMPEMTTLQPFNQQPFEPQAPFPGQPQFPFASMFNNPGQGQAPTPPPPPPSAPSNPPMFPPTEPSPYAPTFPPPTNPFFVPTSLHPTTANTVSTPPPPTRAPPPPKTTIDGIGRKCLHTAECSAGCCFDSSGVMLDTDTYGPNGLRNGLVTGTCQMKQPGLGETCDDLCACKQGFECYRRYKPNYKQGKIMAQNPLYEPPSPPSKPKRTCMRKAVTLAERWAFWKCYFDTACSGPLLK
ncbi:uncharacterized protein [Argopecten irradians]|uniref:uncharacterized protein n=1 Tax=Argopecten irradians TaxID=31199 RepID=UPI003718405F